MAVVSGPLSCVGFFGVWELHQTIEASLSMFSVVWHFGGAGWCEVALFLATVLVLLLLLEAQMSVFSMVVICILAGVLGGCLWIDPE